MNVRSILARVSGFYKTVVKKIKSIDVKEIISEIKKRPKLAISTGALLVLIPVFLVMLFKPKHVEADWFNEGWRYRKPITITYSGTSELTDYQIMISSPGLDTLYTNGKINQDGSDLRFTDINGETLNYYIEDNNDDNDTVDLSSDDHVVWIKIPRIELGGTTIYMYYGNPNALPQSSGDQTFDFFDDFNDASLDGDKWDSDGYATFSGITYTEDESTLKVYSNGSVWGILQADVLYQPSDTAVVEAKISESASSNWIISCFMEEDSDSNRFNINDGDDLNFNVQTRVDGVYSSPADTLNVISAGSWYITRLEKESSTQMQAHVLDTDYSVLDSTSVITESGWSDESWTWVTWKYQTDISNYDWIRFRQLAATEPGSPSLGSEEENDGPIVYFSFNQGDGDYAHDEISGYLGALSGPTWFDMGLEGTALNFDGSGDYVQFPVTATGEDFGDGADGDVQFTSDTDISVTNSISGRTCADGGDAVSYSVTALSSNTATLSSSPSSGCLVAGDEVLLINLQSTSSPTVNTGNYEVLGVSSVSGSTITFTGNKSNYYGDGSNDTGIGTGSTDQKVMLMRVPNYKNVTIDSGTTISSGSWNGTKGGVLYFKASGDLVNNGTISMDESGFEGGTTTTYAETLDGKYATGGGGGGGGGNYGYQSVSGFGGVPNGGDGGVYNTNNGGDGGNSDAGGGGGGSKDSSVKSTGGSIGGGAGGVSISGAGTNGTSGVGGGGGGAFGGGGGGGGANAYMSYGNSSPAGLTDILMGGGAANGGGGGGGGNAYSGASYTGSGGSGGDSIGTGGAVASGSGNCTNNACSSGSDGTAGDPGGGIVILGAKNIYSVGTISADGGNGGSGGNGGYGGQSSSSYCSGGGGGGWGADGAAGGSILIQTSNAQLSTVSANGGDGGGKGGGGTARACGAGNSGAGGSGRDGGYGDRGVIAIEYDQSVNDKTIENATYSQTSLLSSYTQQTFDQLDDLSDTLSISLWFRQAGSISSDQYLFSKYSSAGYKVYMKSTGVVCVGIDDDSSWGPDDEACTTTTYADKKWHNATAVIDKSSGDIYIYVDGEQGGTDGSLAASGSIANTASGYIGIDSDGSSNGWQGQIDEFRIYGDSISTDKIAELYNKNSGAYLGQEDPLPSYDLSNNLIGYWKFDESSWNGTSDEVKDSSGNGNDGTSVDGASINTNGKFVNAGAFDGTDDHVDFGSDSQLHIDGDMTISAWVKPDDFSGTQAILGKMGSPMGAYWLALSGYNLQFNWRDSAGDLYQRNSDDGFSASDVDVWNHVVGVKRGDILYVFINGVREDGTGSSTATGSVYGGTGALRSGEIGGSYSYDGDIDEIRYYDRALTDEEVQHLYQIGTGSAMYLDFNEGSGTTLNDISGNGNNGTTYSTILGDSAVSNLEWSGLGKFGNTIKFGGFDEWATVADSNTLDRDHGVAISAYVNPANITNDMIVASKKGAYSLRIGDGKASFGIENVSTMLSGISGINDVFYYDTTQDNISDDWRFDSTASWYTETIDNTYADCNVSTDDRCGTQYFPEKALLVSTDTALYVFDAEANAMWMKFLADSTGSEGYLIGAGSAFANHYVTKAKALDGKIHVGSSTAFYIQIDMINDSAKFYSSDGSHAISIADISERNNTGNSGGSAYSSEAIRGYEINDLDVGVFNGSTYIVLACGSSDGISVVNDTAGNVATFYYNNSDPHAKVAFRKTTGDVWYNWDYNGDHWPRIYIKTLASMSFGGADQSGSSGLTYYIQDDANYPSIINPESTNATLEALYSDEVGNMYVGNEDGVSILSGTFTGSNGKHTGGAVKHITKDYISEKMSGQITAMYPFYGTGSIANSATVDEIYRLNYNATASNSNGTGMAYVDGVRGNGINFDGIDDSLSTTTTSNLIDNDGLTISLWIKPDGEGPTPNYNDVIYGDLILSDSGFNIGLSQANINGEGDKLWFFNNDGSTDKVGVSYTPGEWVHVAMIHNGGTIYIYKNGELVDSTTSGNTSSVSNTMYIGHTGSSSGYFDGVLDEVMFGKAVYTAGQIKDLYLNGYRALVANGTSSLNGSSNNIQAVAGVPISTSGFSYTDDKAMLFVGTDTGGLSQIDLTTDSLVNYYTGSTTPSIVDESVQAISPINAFSWYVGIDDTSDGVSKMEDVSSDTNLIANEYNHIMGTYSNDDDEMSIYVNGVLESTVTLDGTISTNSNDLYIGGYENDDFTAAPFDGFIDELRIYGHTPTSYQIARSVPGGTTVSSSGKDLKMGRIVHLKLDELSGTTAHDATGSSDDFTISGAAWSSEGRFNGGLDFDGSDDYITSGTESGLDSVFAEQFSISMWFKHAPTISADEYLIAKEDDRGFKFFMESDGQICGGIDDDSSFGPDDYACATNAYNDNNWHHALFVVDRTAGYVKVFVDVVDEGSDETISATGLIENEGAVYIGIDSDGSSSAWDGMIDDVKVYDFALTKDELYVENNRAAVIQLGANVADVRNESAEGYIGYWDFDESSGNANDSSGNGYTLTNNNTTAYEWGKYDRAGSFTPGSSHYFSTASTLSGVKSVSFWTYPDSTTNYFVNLASGVYISSSSGTLSATGFTNPRIFVNGVASTTIASGEWQLVTVTTDTAISANSFAVGQISSNYMDGKIDDLKVYNRAISPKEINQLYKWGPGPVAWYKMDEASGDYAYDSSGNELTGTLVNSGPSAPWVGNGMIGSALDFDGSTDAVSISDDDKLDITNNFSISAWFYRDVDSELTERILSKSDTDGYDYFYQINSSGYYQCGVKKSDTNNYYETSTDLAVVGEWVHFECTHDPDNGYTLYINGYPVSSATTGTAGSANTDTTDLQIGRMGANSTWYHSFDGRIDDVRVYNYARTARQVKDDMSGDNTSLHPIARWTFDEGTGQTVNSSHLDKFRMLDTSLQGYLGSSATTTSNDATWESGSDCYSGSCLSFGFLSDDYAYFGDTGILVKTLVMWLKPSNVMANSVFKFSTNNWVSITSGYMDDSGLSNQVFYVNGVEDGPISSGEWSHVVVVIPNGENASDANMGSVAFLNYYYGLVDTIEFYDYAFDAADVAQSYAEGAASF